MTTQRPYLGLPASQHDLHRLLSSPCGAGGLPGAPSSLPTTLTGEGGKAMALSGTWVYQPALFHHLPCVPTQEEGPLKVAPCLLPAPGSHTPSPLPLKVTHYHTLWLHNGCPWSLPGLLVEALCLERRQHPDLTAKVPHAGQAWDPLYVKYWLFLNGSAWAEIQVTPSLASGA